MSSGPRREVHNPIRVRPPDADWDDDEATIARFKCNRARGALLVTDARLRQILQQTIDVALQHADAQAIRDAITTFEAIGGQQDIESMRIHVNQCRVCATRSFSLSCRRLPTHQHVCIGTRRG